MASRNLTSIELQATEYRPVSPSEVYSMSSWSSSTRKLSTIHDGIETASEDDLLRKNSVAGHEIPHARPDVRAIITASTKALRYARMNTWLGEPTGPRKYRGWRKAVVAAAIITAVVLLANIVLLVTAVARYESKEGVGVLYTGDCGLVNRWSTALHLLINILGTCLLSASSFTMQCLSSPSRSETDRAHSRRVPLEIGVPSVKNLFYMHRWKGCLWWALCLSTIPLHLLWNSSVFSTIGANEFNYLVVEESFLTGAEYLAPVIVNQTTSSVGEHDVMDPAQYLKGYQEHRYKRLEVAECLDAYMATFLTSYRKFVAVTTPQTGVKMSPGEVYPTFQTDLRSWYGNDSWIADRSGLASLEAQTIGYPQPLWNGSSVLAYQSSTGSTLWQCFGWPVYDGTSDLPLCDKKFADEQLRMNGTWWLRPFDLTNIINPQALQAYAVDYCLVEDQDVEQCQLQYVSYILVVVILCNITKLGCMVATAHYLWNKEEPILATIGDAVSSYMETPDETTANWCLMDHTSCKVWQARKSGHDKWSSSAQEVDLYQREPTIRLLRATSTLRWWTTMSFCMAYLLLGIGLLCLATSTARDSSNTTSLSAVWSTYGLGQVTNSNTLGSNVYSGSRSLLSSILIANSFQLVLSMTYFMFNSLWTAQCSAMEWASYIDKRKSLRVTWPRGQQKSTYYLNLPYRYGIPLTLMLALLHFLISQSIFLARVQYYNADGSMENKVISDAAYSPLGILVTVCVASSLILASVAHSFRRIDNRMPVHGNSSAVISALCHTTRGRDLNCEGVVLEHPAQNMAERKVMWGVVTYSVDVFKFKNDFPLSISSQGPIGHCAFTAEDVDPPEVGRRYR